MSFWDDMQVQVESLGSKVASTASDFISSNVSAAAIRVGPAPTGNLTAEQLAAGQRGSSTNQNAPASTQDPNWLMRAGSVSVGGYNVPILALAAAAGAIWYFKRRR
jgi:hypothetical protein